MNYLLAKFKSNRGRERSREGRVGASALYRPRKRSPIRRLFDGEIRDRDAWS